MVRAKSWRKTVVVGAGPVGALAALYAANRGDQVEVYDLRPDPREPSLGSNNLTKSINLALSERGINALRSSGHDDLLESVFSTTIPMHGRMIHTRSRTGALEEHSQAYDSVHGRYQRSVDRNELSRRLLDKLDTMPNVTIYFQQKLTGADFDSKHAWFEDLKDSRAGRVRGQRVAEYEVSFDLLLGADGAYSAVRFHMMKFTRMDYRQEYIDCLWCEFTMDPTEEIGYGHEKYPEGYQISPNHLHIWPAGSSMFIALPSPGGIMVCTLFGTVKLFSELEAACKTDKENVFLAAFENLFPGVTQYIPPQDLIETFKANPHLPLINIKCTPHHYNGSVAILGDAANAMVPFYGQGMNAGLESVRVLFDIIDRSKEAQGREEAGFAEEHHDGVDWHDPEQCLAAALREYTLIRTPDTHAIADLALGNYAEMASGVTSRKYKLRKYIEETLDKWVPRLDWKTQYARVSFGNERYSDVVQKVGSQGRILNVLLNGAGFGLLGTAAYIGLKMTKTWTGMGLRWAPQAP